ncbi:MAG: T9SS type A sorting domain-containing protein [Bacteroidales bacterium]
MRLKTINLPVFLILFSNAFAQFPPPAGQEGSTAIHKDSSIFVNWAIACTVERGSINIAEPDLGTASAGTADNATGTADNQIVSLGDGGTAVVIFEKPIANGTGPDFAVFENGFFDDFLELAFVEVSSNGVNFFRFDAVSLTSTDVQVGSFGLLNATELHNLAGKYRIEYGTPFDLDELPEDADLNKESITHIRIVDVVGSIDNDFASYDSQGNKVNDPWPTAFESSGFDLDAVGVIHEGSQSVDYRNAHNRIRVYPNPANEVLYILSGDHVGSFSMLICDLSGKPVYRKETAAFADGTIEISFDGLAPGIYIGTIYSNGNNHSFKVIRR